MPIGPTGTRTKPVATTHNHRKSERRVNRLSRGLKALRARFSPMAFGEP
jgi:hypothetical protein